MPAPTVSVIIPCYKQAHFLRECIGSLQAQSMPDWEAIVVDDGSPDDTAKTTQEVAREDCRIRLHSKANGGLSSARNAGLRQARGRFIQFLDADDLLLPSKFEHQLREAAAMHPRTITYTDYWHGKLHAPMQVARPHVDLILRHPRPICDFAARWEHDFSIPIHSPIFPRSLLIEHSINFDESLPNHEDWDFWMRVVRISSGLHFIPELLAIYRESPLSMSADLARMWAGFNIAIRKQKVVHADDLQVRRYLLGLSYRNSYRHRRGLAGMMRAVIDSGAKKYIPWPVQRIAMGRIGFLGIVDKLN